MPDPASEVPPPRPPPRLPEGAVFEGLLVLPGAARIDGTVRGEVLAASDLWVGPNGAIEADLEVRAVVIEGRVEGDVMAGERIELRSSARIRGNVSAPSLAIAEGCVVDGSCSSGGPPTAQRGVASP
jgi:cytoskeletal protein CcmA (bactofilin family)